MRISPPTNDCSYIRSANRSSSRVKHEKKKKNWNTRTKLNNMYGDSQRMLRDHHLTFGFTTSTTHFRDGTTEEET